MSSVSPPPLTNLLGGSATTAATTETEYIPPVPRHTTSSLGNLSPSILIIILILAVTIVASVSLCFLLRHLNRRCLRHLSSSTSAAASSSSSSAAAADSHRLSSRRVSPENPAEALLDSLPVFAFSSVTRRRAESAVSAAADCAVCLSKFEPEDQLRLLPLCCHAFHALCVDTWLRSNQTCPLCRSPIFASDAEILKTLGGAAAAAADNRCNGDSFRIEIGNISRRQTTPFDNNDNSFSSDSRRRSRSYSIGSFDYLVDEDSEILLSTIAAHRRSVSDFKEENRQENFPAPEPATEPNLLAAEVASSGRSWLKDYVDRLSMSLSSRATSFRSSGRFFSGSSRRSDVIFSGGGGEWDLEASRVGEEISELFRWASGV